MVKLFNVLGLKPQAGANAKAKNSKAEVRSVAQKPISIQTGKKVKEIVGDGEEIEVDDGEELSKSEIDAIYNKYEYFLRKDVY